MVQFGTRIGYHKGHRFDLFVTAAHEMGHGLAAVSSDLEVYGMTLKPNNTGMTITEITRSPIKDIRVAVAGYVASQTIKGEEASWTDMVDDPVNSGDVRDVRKAMEDRRLKRYDTIDREMERMVSFFADPIILNTLRRGAFKLLKANRFSARAFQAQLY